MTCFIKLQKQTELIRVINEQGSFEPFHDFEYIRSLADKYINQGVVMGEGWLIPAEMAALAETGVKNIICTQPFGCLPNHIISLQRVCRALSRRLIRMQTSLLSTMIRVLHGSIRRTSIKLMLANAVMD